jgi:hypothetical protein
MLGVATRQRRAFWHHWHHPVQGSDTKYIQISPQCVCTYEDARPSLSFPPGRPPPSYLEAPAVLEDVSLDFDGHAQLQRYKSNVKANA